MKDFNFEQFNHTPTIASKKAISLSEQQNFARQLYLFQTKGITQEKFNQIKESQKYHEKFLSLIKIRPKKTKYNRPSKKNHKLATPKCIINSIKFGIGKKFVAPIKKHDINLNPYFRNYRIKKEMRLNIRTEAEECFKALAPALIKYCDFNIRCKFLFEVKAPLSQIANEIGLLNKNGRYDRVNSMINTLRKIGVLIVINEFDKDLYVQKASRIFLLPDFFYSLGHTEQAFKKEVMKLDRFFTRKGKTEFIDKRNQAHEERLKRSNIADITANKKTIAFFKVLQHVKQSFLNDSIFKKAFNYSEKAKKKEPTKTNDLLIKSSQTTESVEQVSPEKWAKRINDIRSILKPKDNP
ncbi:hypothetical protein QJU11_10090 [Pasteurella atlantica]|uniref:hypothetical protein n=1 Tax=Phocoenobacter atlanticus TaxID=3416742 RepID=UPI00277843E3|nr:hypothetical protein [Pasteurella atlantica]MDP8042541.1 hypothetical protein [Pasteurella atlantica]